MVQTLEFNPFGENTYVVYDRTKECVIIDPGCFDDAERSELQQFIQDNGLRPVRLLNTHCHLDHVFGNRWVAQTWGLGLEIHRGELPVLDRVPTACQMYGIPWTEPLLPPSRFIEPGEVITFGVSKLQVLFTPGHSPASLSFYNEEEAWVVAGDVLFYEGIGRTDLPGSDLPTLLESIRNQLFTLPPATLVYPGHGPTTTIRHEMEESPFLI
jgi:glyoxylase-like metal-dependent hydrolase (beta-lactamase superfamily II)